MKEFCWATDIHLDHAHEVKMEYFARKVNERPGEFVVIGGDISNGVSIVRHLQWLSYNLPNKKIAFVLGNHDYYGSSIYEVQDLVRSLWKDKQNFTNLIWLEKAEPVKLSDTTALIGSGLWCDWRAGDYTTSNVWIADYQLIADFKPLWGGGNNPLGFYTDPLLKRVRQVAEQHAKGLKKKLEKAIEDGYKKVICVTHVPPFWEGSFFGGKVQEADWAVHFVCQVGGNYLKEVMEKNPEVHLTVLSGHTHGDGMADILPNLHVINGSAKYKKPMPQNPIYYE